MSEVSSLKAAAGVAKKKGTKPIKYCKAPQAPKRFKSAFIFFTMHRHGQIRKRLEREGGADKTPDVAKIVSEEWRNFTPEERAVWDEKASLDKERYEVEKTMYTGPWKIPARKRSLKDPAAPKRPMSSFLSFSNAKRSEVKEQNPGMSNTDASKLLAKMWKEAPEKEKKVHICREAELREQYKKEMLLWREKNKREEHSVREKREEMALNVIANRNRSAAAGTSGPPTTATTFVISSDLSLGGGTAQYYPGGPSGNPYPIGGNHHQQKNYHGGYQAPTYDNENGLSEGGYGSTREYYPRPNTYPYNQDFYNQSVDPIPSSSSYEPQSSLNAATSYAAADSQHASFGAKYEHSGGGNAPASAALSMYNQDQPVVPQWQNPAGTTLGYYDDTSNLGEYNSYYGYSRPLPSYSFGNYSAVYPPNNMYYREGPPPQNQTVYPHENNSITFNPSDNLFSELEAPLNQSNGVQGSAAHEDNQRHYYGDNSYSNSNVSTFFNGQPPSNT